MSKEDEVEDSEQIINLFITAKRAKLQTRPTRQGAKSEPIAETINAPTGYRYILLNPRVFARIKIIKPRKIKPIM